MSAQTLVKTGLEPPTRIRVSQRGQALLLDPFMDKGTAFTQSERQTFELEGLLPPQVSTIDQQIDRTYANLKKKPDPLEQYIGMIALQDRNETLFYRLLSQYIEELMPIVYTPTVGLACQQYSHIYRRARGLWISPKHRGRIKKVLTNSPNQNIRLIVVTDNQRILGLGDLGAGGIGIPIGKLALYTAAAGIHPTYCLPISLDVGTDNTDLLEDDLYLGWRHKRLKGQEYDEFVEEFVQAVIEVFPDAVLQWEDFKKQNAFRLLDRYHDRLTSFNDDIQGTAAVGVAAVLASMRITDLPIEQQRIMMVGSGAAGIGICRQLRDLFKRNGITGDDLIRCICSLDSQGVLHDGRELTEETKKEFAWPMELAKQAGLPLESPGDLEAAVHAFKPTVLIGASGQPDIFTEPVITAMAQYCQRPVILPFSNPNSKCEAKPVDLIQWTKGKAIIATGSPFDPVQYNGHTFEIGQGNNVFIFPGVGLGVLVANASVVTEQLFTVAAQTLADHVTDNELKRGKLFPDLNRLREVTTAIAESVVQSIGEQGIGKKFEKEQIHEAVTSSMWIPDYPVFVPG